MRHAPYRTDFGAGRVDFDEGGVRAIHLPARGETAATAEAPPAEEPPAQAPLVEEPPAWSAPEAVEEPRQQAVESAAVDVPPETAPSPPDPAAERPAPSVQNWYAFWSPFRSRVAADGFIAELQRTTGLDYRVVKLKPGIYEVAFAYTDDADIRDKLDRITAATGMDMTGG